METKTYNLTIEFDKYKKQFKGVTNICHPGPDNDHMLTFTSGRGESFRFNSRHFVSYAYEEERHEC